MDRKADRGFTLVEVLITIIVAGVLGASLMGLLLGQQRFYGHADDSILAQQNIRAALDLMGAELRMANPTDIVAAEADSVTVRFDIKRGIVCGLPNSGQAYVFVYDSVGSANLPGGVWGMGFSGAYDSTWVYKDGFTPNSSVSQTAMDVCKIQKDVPAARPLSEFRQTGGWGGVDPEEGSLARWYGKLSYRLSGSSTVPNAWAIWRSGQEFVTPFANTSRFRYVMDNGSVQNQVAAGQIDRIRRIRIEATAIGEVNNRYGVNRPIVYDIPLRNCTKNC